MALKHDMIACLGEFVGTTLFLLMALGGAKTAQFTRSSVQTQGQPTALDNQTIMFISVSFGLSLLSTAWVFYRVTGGLFNPAITLALFIIGGLGWVRAVLLFVAQMLGGIAAAALVAALTPFGGSESVTTTLGTGVNVAQGLFIEMFLTAVLVLTVLLLAAEKSKSTFLAPLGIGVTLLACHMFGVVWTGCGINPARAFGPSVVAIDFPGYHWIYWLGPFLGSMLAVGFYLLLKAFDYTAVVFGQDSDHDDGTERHVLGQNHARRLKAHMHHHSLGHMRANPINRFSRKSYGRKRDGSQNSSETKTAVAPTKTSSSTSAPGVQLSPFGGRQSLHQNDDVEMQRGAVTKQEKSVDGGFGCAP